MSVWLKRNAVRMLWGINVLSILFAFRQALLAGFPDAKGYWLMSEGFRHGRFSSWYFLDTYYPETLRTPGYPLFLYALRTLYDSEFFVLLFQLVLYFVTLIMAFGILKRMTSSRLAACCFLTLTALNIQLPYYSGYISADSMHVFFLVLYVYLITSRRRNIAYAILLGLVGAAAFQMRPAFLLLPYLLTIIVLLAQRTELKYFLVHTLVFSLCLLPFALWNLNNHGVFKVTPVEGGAGVAHIGYWSYRLPPGYQETYYWGNQIGYDLTNPFRPSAKTETENVIAFQQEWETINGGLSNRLSAQDSVYLAYMHRHNPGIFPLYSSAYTLAREQMLWEQTIRHIRSDPWFYLKTRAYTFCRLYFTGINYDAVRTGSIAAAAKAVYPFFITFPCIFLGLCASLGYFFVKKGSVTIYFKLLLLISIYYGCCHIPFAAQARYIVPVHFFILILVSCMLSRVIKFIRERPGKDATPSHTPTRML